MPVSDVDMRAQRPPCRNARPPARRGAPPRLLDRRVETGRGAPSRFLIRFRHRTPRPMRDKRQAEQGLVEVDMAFHERRHEKGSAAVEKPRRRAFRNCLSGRRDGGRSFPPVTITSTLRPSASPGSGQQQRRRFAPSTGSARPGGAATTL